MSDLLAIPNLLMRLDRRRIDAGVYQHCLEAEQVCQRGEGRAAVALARAAARLAVDDGQPLTIGCAFLYLAYIRESSQIEAERRRAADDCDTAIQWLKRDDHHCALAEMIKARVLLNTAQARAAIEHYGQAAYLLARLAARARRQNQSNIARDYKDLRRAVTNAMQHIPIDAPGDHPDRAQHHPPTELPVLSKYLAIPMRVSWAEGQPIGIALMPSPRGVAPDFIEVTYVWVGGKPYTIQPLDADPNVRKSFRLRPGEPYVALQVKVENGPDEDEERFALVRRTDRPDQSPQYIVVVDPISQRAWIDGAESDATSVRTVGLDRYWQISDGAEPRAYDDSELRIVGVVEAMLLPAPQDTTTN